MHVALQIALRLMAGINKVTEETRNYMKLGAGSIPYQTFFPVTEGPTGTWGAEPPLKTLFPLGVCFGLFLYRFSVRVCKTQKSLEVFASG